MERKQRQILVNKPICRICQYFITKYKSITQQNLVHNNTTKMNILQKIRKCKTEKQRKEYIE